ncbi:hypothetical protein MRX96_038700 [Rhipicephalus microplus]
MVAEGFRVGAVNGPVEAVGPPVTYVNVYRYPVYLSDEILSNALAQYEQPASTEVLATASSDPETSDLEMVSSLLSPRVSPAPLSHRGSLGTSQAATSVEGTTETDSEELERGVASVILTSGAPVLKPGEDARERTREDAPILVSPLQRKEIESTIFDAILLDELMTQAHQPNR